MEQATDGTGSGVASSVVLHVRDSRRLTGPSRFWDLPSAILDIGSPVCLDEEPAGESDAALFRCPSQQLIECWTTWARRILDAVGWQNQSTTTRTFEDGVSLLLSAPIDSLYAATDVNEFAFEAAVADLLRAPRLDFEARTASLRDAIAQEKNPALLRLAEFAAAHQLLFLSDDNHASIGGGTGSMTWPVDALPSPESLAQLLTPRLPESLGKPPQRNRLRNIKIAAVSGTNGKSTTVRLLSCMAGVAKMGPDSLTPGVTSTDWIKVGDEVIETGDYSGPGGARTVLRDQRVNLALLEAARGGLNRRGLGVPRVDVAALTNIGSDHLGEHGSAHLEDLLDTKWTIARVADHVVLNLDDPLLRVRGLLTFKPGSPQLTWCTAHPDDPVVAQHAREGGTAVLLYGNEIVALAGAHQERMVSIDEIPITLEGAASHNIANALTAVATARALGLSTANIEHGLRTFGQESQDNPGRLTQFIFTVGSVSQTRPGQAPAEDDAHSVRVIVDFAHNPEGVDALLAVAENLAPARWLITLGQAGDREDDAIRGLADVAWRYRPSRILIKDLDEYRRGRKPGEVSEMIQNRLLKLGAPPASVERTGGEWDTVVSALRWAQPGDLLMLTVHSERDAIMSRLQKLQDMGWVPGSELPTTL